MEVDQKTSVGPQYDGATIRLRARERYRCARRGVGRFGEPWAWSLSSSERLSIDIDDDDEVVYQTPIDNRRAMIYNRCKLLEKAMGRY